MERAHAIPCCTARAIVSPELDAIKLLLIFTLIRLFERTSAPNPSFRFILELLAIGKGKPLGLRRQFPRGASSRTPVTDFAAFESYRFFSTLPPECPDETPVPRCRSLDSHPQTSLCGNLVCGLFDRRAGGYAGAAEQNSRGRLLLPLRGIEFKYRVRKDVRFEKVRAALVGEDLRQTPHANSCQ